MEEAQKVLSEASKKNGMPVEPDQIVLTKPSTSSAKGSFLDIMKHPTLRLHLIIMYFNWFTTAFIMYGLALSWQVTCSYWENPFQIHVPRNSQMDCS